jgi:hypothetical protein
MNSGILLQVDFVLKEDSSKSKADVRFARRACKSVRECML